MHNTYYLIHNTFMDLLQNIFKQVDSVSKKTKVPTYVVGGFVRDFLMGREQKKDIDFVVVGSGLEFAKKFDEAMKKKGSLVEFLDFDTARYIIQVKSLKSKVESSEEVILEFAGARAEKYKADSRKPTVDQADLEQDLARRDFTVNTMAVPISKLSSRGVKRRGDPTGLSRRRVGIPLVAGLHSRFSPHDIIDPV